MKSLTNEFGKPLGKDRPLKVTGLSEEHGHVDASGTEIDAGMKIDIVPSITTPPLTCIASTT
jgi:hypothetical protein